MSTANPIEVEGAELAWSSDGEGPATLKLEWLDPPVSERLESIEAATTVIVGERDVEDFKLTAAYIAERLPNASLLRLPDCAHLVPLERPGEVAGVL